MKYDLGLINGKIYYDGLLHQKNIYLLDGKIEKIKGQYLNAEVNIDCKSKIVLPGLIDPHVHLREPGLTHKEDFLTGSMAAAHGGVTTIIDMPNTKPPTLTIKDLRLKRKLAKKCLVNYGFHFGSSTNNLKDIKKAWKNNIASVKIFLNHTTGNLMIEDDEIISKIMDISKLVTLHAEGKKVKKILELKKGKKTKTYFCHISTKEEIDTIKRELIKPYVEATPHHLFLTEKDVEDSFREMYPSLKSKEDQRALWGALKAGIITTIGSDHAPHTKEEKKSKDAPRGVPGLETTLPLLLNAVHNGRITIRKIVELCCENPAKIFGIEYKGKIERGYDADLVVIDLNKKWKVEGDKFFTKCKWSPFEGFILKGTVDKTLVNGNVIFDGENIIKEKSSREVYFNV